MKRIAIIGGGIVGATCAYYLSKNKQYEITLIDDGEGQATKAACGIICPWLSQRRNKPWYNLVKEGAKFYSQLISDLKTDGMLDHPYVQTGTMVFKKTEQQLNKLMLLAEDKRINAPQIGNCRLMLSTEIDQIIPNYYGDQGAVLVEGGGRIDGKKLVEQLITLSIQKGMQLKQGKAQLINHQCIMLNQQLYEFDQIILTVGAWLPQLLSPLGYRVDIRPQKGQLLEVKTTQATEKLPGMMLHDEIDILPSNDHRLIIGATHENDKEYNLEPDYQLLEQMKRKANEFLAIEQYPIDKVRVGIRAYTSDYQPFFGYLKEDSFLVASGLGSSGLTSGPIIGYLLSCLVTKQKIEMDISEYCPDKYIKK